MTIDTAPPVIDGTTVHTRATTYTVTCLPDDPYDGDSWAIKVEFRGAHIFDEPRPADQQWAVILRGHWHLSRSGKWDLRPSSDDDGYDDWITAHRFDLETALKVAAEQAPHVVVNGCTPADLLAWRAGR
jgi:hypothetical protein